MERSPQSAGVRPRTGASMGHYHTLRSIVISLTIAITVTRSPASGFTIPRIQKILYTTSDLETAESTNLEVKYDVKTLYDNKAINNNKTKEYSDSSVIAINDFTNTNKISNDSEKVYAIPLIVNETDTQNNLSDDSKFEVPSDLPKIISTETLSYTFTTSLPSTDQTTTTQTEKSQDVSKDSFPYSSLPIESQTDIIGYSSPTIENYILEKRINENETENIDTQNVKLKLIQERNNTTKSIVSGDDINSYKTNNIIDYFKKLNDSAFNYEEQKDTRSIFNVESKDKNDTNGGDQKADQTSNKEETSIAMTNGSLDALTTTLSDATNDILEVSTTEMTTEKFTSETFTTDFYPPTLPSWKKYTTIDRKRTSTEDTTSPGKDMTQAETAQTRISLEKVFSNTPIPSLEKLRNDLINAQESSTSKVKTTTDIEKEISNVTDTEKSISTPKIVAMIETTKTNLEIVSKRAGFKDNKETTTLKPEQATTSEFPPKVSANDKEMFISVYETEASEVEVTDYRNDTVYESQSQLAEDAIKEELLKEKLLNDKEENAKRYHDESLILPRDKHLKQGNNTNQSESVSEMITEDMLSVKPIGQEKKKNTILYAVSPNYKPLKKIDVQPQKQFVRDPDDNSWRNESISSLGIVFKPKNASKSFTQVLKNKTETELGIMTDKDNKDDLPDLRVRLEKIAEVRKSKKKINKYGDTVYSDYEESSENVNSSKEDITSPMTPSIKSVLSFTPTPSSKSSTTEFDLTVNAISKENLNFVKNEVTTPLTTIKPNKLYNLADYYDASDEYDADYINLHKIDLKKFTQPLKAKESLATQPPQMLRTKPMTEYQPERKATLQYFPPTQKVNMNDYDADFRRKVNMYTFKAPSKSELSAFFGTVSPIQTEKYEQVSKITMRPTYSPTPKYQTDHLDKNQYLTNQPRASEPPTGFVPNDGNFDRASYVIKHYRDFINEAAKGSEDEKNGEYPFTESPIRGVTINELAKITAPRYSNQGEEEYDYDTKFRKDIMNRFVDNFNQNSDRFKVDFPILYNSSVVHRPAPVNGRVASSTAFIKRLYETRNQRPNFISNRKACDPNCDMTVELSPAYELHYYVPDQEEKEEIEPRSITVPYRYRL